MSKIVCFGEVLWDVFPNHKKIGGAPLNVALRLSSYKNDVCLISAVGNDELGRQIIDYLQSKNVNTENIQQLNSFETGQVLVSLNEKGHASYEISHPKAWDKIEFKEEVSNTIKFAKAIIFGSLVARDTVSKKTLLKYLQEGKFKVFDVNLRPPHYDLNILVQLMEIADFIKFNDEELYEISSKLGSEYNNLEQNIYFLAKKTNTKQICVTKGEHGAVLLINDKLYYNSGYKIKVADTVGSGDSFLASLIHKLLEGEKPQKSIDFACAVGALVAKNKGANPVILTEEIQDFIR